MSFTLLSRHDKAVPCHLRHFLRNAREISAYVPFQLGTLHGVRLSSDPSHHCQTLEQLLNSGYALILNTTDQELSVIVPEHDYPTLHRVQQESPEVMESMLREQLRLTSTYQNGTSIN